MLCVFAIGWMIGQSKQQGGGETSPPSSREIARPVEENTADKNPSSPKNTNAATSPADEKTRSLVNEIHSAMGEGAEQRKAKLLPILERSTELPLSRELLATFQEVLDGGDLEEGQYVLSLMEQREEKASVAFLVKALEHPQAEIAERALFACEAVGGTVFADAQAARQWAESWQPDPQRAALFAPKSQQDVEASSVLPGARQRNSTQKTPEK